ncbi:MAG: hypothetical protein WD492_06090 [Alkalispirochaeta sp.]
MMPGQENLDDHYDSGYIHHYTSLESLALILSGRKIRFNRLDRVDDVVESAPIHGYDLAQFLYVSCWSDDKQESIQMWQLTPGMSGVRISVPADMFQRKPLPKDAQLGVWTEPGTESLFTYDELFRRDRWVLPLCNFWNAFYNEVEYVSDPQVVREEHVTISLNQQTGSFSMQSAGPSTIAKYKGTEWAWQNEVRFVILATPGQSNVNTATLQNLPNRFATAVANHHAPEATSIDADLSDEAIERIKIRRGPLMSKGQRTLLESIIDRYAPNATVQDSRFTGKIRIPRR